jgi:hypothetical protein
MGGIWKVEVYARGGVYDVVLTVEEGGSVEVKVVKNLQVVLSSCGKSVDEAAGKLVEALRKIEAALEDAVKVAKRLEGKPAQGVV